MEQAVTIQAKKYDGKLHYEWDAKLIELNEQYAVIYCEAGRTLIHHTKQKQFTIPYVSIEWFYFDRGYTVAVSCQPKGLMYYCNIALPAVKNGHTISFTDLDLDYLKEVDEQWKVVDEDEFERHQLKYGYPDDVVQFAYNSLTQLQQAVAEQQTPFDLTEEHLLSLIAAMPKA